MGLHVGVESACFLARGLDVEYAHVFLVGGKMGMRTCFVTMGLGVEYALDFKV